MPDPTEYARDHAEWKAAAEARARREVLEEARTLLKCAQEKIRVAAQLGACVDDVALTIEDALAEVAAEIEPEPFRSIGSVSALVVDRALAARAAKEAAE